MFISDITLAEIEKYIAEIAETEQLNAMMYHFPIYYYLKSVPLLPTNTHQNDKILADLRRKIAEIKWQEETKIVIDSLPN